MRGLVKVHPKTLRLYDVCGCISSVLFFFCRCLNLFSSLIQTSLTDYPKQLVFLRILNMFSKTKFLAVIPFLTLVFADIITPQRPALLPRNSELISHLESRQLTCPASQVCGEICCRPPGICDTGAFNWCQVPNVEETCEEGFGLCPEGGRCCPVGNLYVSSPKSPTRVQESKAFWESRSKVWC